MPHPLDTFFSPDSIALIGASRNPEKIPGRLLSMLRKNEFPGKRFPINPNYGDIDGLKCYPSIAAVGRPIDFAIVIIPARAVLGALRGMRRRQRQERGDHLVGIRRGGRRERRHAGRDRRSRRDDRHADFRAQCGRIYIAKSSTSPLPSSPTVDVKSDAPRLIATTRRIGIVAQSGGIGFAIYHRAKALGIALSYVVSAGNESDLGAGEFLEYIVQDSSTDVILLFIEGIRDVEEVSRRGQAGRGNRQARHRHQGRPLGRGRAGGGVAYREHGRLVRCL